MTTVDRIVLERERIVTTELAYQVRLELMEFHRIRLLNRLEAEAVASRKSQEGVSRGQKRKASCMLINETNHNSVAI